MGDHISREQVKELMDSFVPLMKFGGASEGVRKGFTVPVGLSTTCTVRFEGAVSIDAYDALLAHVAFYKTLLPQDGSDAPEPIDPKKFANEIVDRIFRAPTPPTTGDAG